MKQITSFLLSVFILLSSSGFGYAQHFCLGHEVASQFTFGHSDLSCGMEMPMPSCNERDTEPQPRSCCDDTFLSITIDDCFASKTIALQTSYFLLPTHFYNFKPVVIQGSQSTKQVVSYTLPPPKIPIYIQNNVFLI